jgi:RNA polymerase sigma factor (sigma-70 family)
MKRQREPTVVPIRGDTADDIFVGSALMDGADPAIEAEDGEAETPETILMRQSQTAAVRAAIESLPDPFREALVLRELEELSYREIAQITAAPIGTIMSRLARARQMFAASWRARFTEDETMHRGTSELGRT